MVRYTAYRPGQRLNTDQRKRTEKAVEMKKKKVCVSITCTVFIWTKNKHKEANLLCHTLDFPNSIRHSVAQTTTKSDFFAFVGVIFFFHSIPSYQDKRKGMSFLLLLDLQNL